LGAVAKATASHKKTANWITSPQRVRLRRALFQIHLWVGIALALYAIVIGLTGSALVFRDEMEHAMWPEVFHVVPAQRTITMQAAVDNIQRARPGWTVFALRDFNTAGQATTAMMRPNAGKLSANYRQVYFNPFTGEVLLDRLRYGGWLGWMANLHEYLLAGPLGLIVSGWMAVGLLVLCGTGIVLWWPGVQRWTSALTVNPRSRWKRLNWELHSAVGFWVCAALVVVTVTGIDFAFPNAIGSIVEFATGDHLASHVASATSQPHMYSGATGAVMTIDQAIEESRTTLPQAAPAGYLQLPQASSAKPQYYATGYYSGSLPYSELVRLAFDAHTGAVLSYGDTRQESRGSRIQQYFTTIHFGSFGGSGFKGLAIKWLWVLVGVAPALLAVSGIIMYWNRKLHPMWLQTQRRKLSAK
jgi:uncharacterized iron-regulated membrane protein